MSKDSCQERVLIIGRSGRLARAIAEELNNSYKVESLGRIDLREFTDFAWLSLDLESRLRRQPKYKAVINCMAMNGLEQCNNDPGMAFYVNVQLPVVLAHLTRKNNIPLIHFSSDYAIAGEANSSFKVFPFDELAETGKPYHIYGQSKRLGEDATRINLHHLTFRLSSIYTQDDLAGSLGPVKQLLANQKKIQVLDQECSPTSTKTIAKAISVVLEGLNKNFNWWGTYHLVCAGKTTKKEFAERAIKLFLGIDYEVGIGQLEIPRPKYCLLSVKRFEATFDYVLPTWEDSLFDQACLWRTANKRNP